MKNGMWEFEKLLIPQDGRKVVLGVDGGSTSTVCVCMEAPLPLEIGPNSPRLLGRAVAGCSNRNSIGEDAAKDTLERVLAEALMAAKSQRCAVQAVCLAISGVDCPSDEQQMLSWLRVLFPTSVHLFVYNDAVAALASGTSGHLHGCVLIAGTGSIAFGLTEDGRKARAGGYGPLLGDQGSGYAIASQALAAVMRAYDGRGPPTALHSAILEALNLSSAHDLIQWAYADTSWARIAALVPIVKKCAAAGDSVAKTLLYNAVQELALSIKAVVQMLHLGGEDGRSPFPLVLVGGVLENDHINLSSALVEHVTRLFPAIQVIQPKVEPAIGAVMLAWIQFLKASNISPCCNGTMSPANES